MKWLMRILVAALLASWAMPGQAQVVEKKALTLEGARQIIATAIGEARRVKAPGGVIAVVDDGGNLMALERLDGTFAAGANISIGKARTAAIFKRPTRAFEDIIKNGRTAMVALPDFTPLQGGVPIVVGDEVVGGIGVSGAASAQQDEELALAGAAAAKALKLGMAGAETSRKVTFIDSQTVAAGVPEGRGPGEHGQLHGPRQSPRDGRRGRDPHARHRPDLHARRIGHVHDGGLRSRCQADRAERAPGLDHRRRRDPPSRQGRRHRGPGRGAAHVHERPGAVELLRGQGPLTARAHQPGAEVPMRARACLSLILAAAVMAAAPAGGAAQTTSDAPAATPAAIINLATEEGVRLVRGQWRYSDARIVDVEHRAPGPDLRPSGPPNRAHDIAPHAGAADFDDSAWAALAPASLESRRGNGRLSFNWYRIKVTIPDRVGTLDPTGATVVFEIVVDDYAEVWVNGRLPTVLGQTGGALVKGFNAPNRVVLGRDVRPGQKFQLAVFGMNGPLSNPPGNFIWMRSATLDFYKPSQAGRVQDVRADVVRLDPALDAIVPASPRLEKLADGFLFTEGPVWVPGPRRRTATCSSATPTPTRSTAGRRTDRSRCSGRRAATRASTSASTGSRARTGSRSTARAGSRSTSTATAGSCALERTGAVTVLADRYQGQAAQQPERPGLPVGRRALLHRPAVRPAEGLRRSAEGAARRAACSA